MFTLKVTYQGKIHHIQVKQRPGYAAVEVAIQQKWPGSIARYRDEEGDLCTLSAPTFSDFLVTAKEVESAGLVLKLEVSPMPCPSNGTPQKRQTQKKIKAKELHTCQGVWEEDPRDIAELAREFEDAPTPARSKGKKRRVNAKGRRGTEGAGGAVSLGGESRSVTGTDSEAEPGAAASLKYQDEDRKDAESAATAEGPDEGIEPATEEEDPEAEFEAATCHEGHGGARQAGESTDPEKVDKADQENDEEVSWWEDPAGGGSEAEELPPEDAPEGGGDDGPPTPQLWPSTPESTPPQSPRFGQGGGRIVWMPVPAWVPVIS